MNCRLEPKAQTETQDNCIEFGRLREARAVVDSAVCIYETHTGKKVTRKTRSNLIDAVYKNPAYTFELLTGAAFESRGKLH